LGRASRGGEQDIEEETQTAGEIVKPLIRGVVRDGMMIHDEDAREYLAVRLHQLEGQRYEMSLEKERKHRSARQRGYFYGVIVETMISNEPFAGWTQEEVRLWIVENYAPRIYGENGLPDKIIPEHSWTTKIQEEINERVRQDLLTKFNVLIPLPNECLY
jgi:hypothetical protein